MAGIGFEIRKILKEKTLSSIFKTIAFASVLSSGPWIISMISILIAGFISYNIFNNKDLTVFFTISVTYIITISLIISGLLQLSFTRYISDTLFSKNYEKIIPTTIGAIIVSMFIGFIVSLPFSISIYNENHTFFAIIFSLTTIIMNGLWIVNIILTGLKNYKYITFSFFFSYLLIIILIIVIGENGIEYFLLSYFIGNLVLFIFLMFLILKNFPVKKLVDFSFLKKLRKDLILIGFLINFAIWIDKILFWINSETSIKVIGLLRYSPIYDYPIFLAYLSLVPSMTIFLIRIEAEFAYYFELYFSNVRKGGTLKELYFYSNEMINIAKYSLIEILRIQALFDIVLVILSNQIFNFFKIPLTYLPLFVIDLITTTLQIFYMSLLTILFYLDKRKFILNSLILLTVLNFTLTLLSQKLGPFFYGYGAAISFLIVSVYVLIKTNQSLQRVNYETFAFN